MFEKLSRMSPEDIPTSQELRAGALHNALRTPGSLQYIRKWRFWSDSCLDAIRYHLSHQLPYPPDENGFNELFYRLGAAADDGKMPSFGNAGARSAYALEFFCRARMLADLLFDLDNPTMPSFWKDACEEKQLLCSPNKQSSINKKNDAAAEEAPQQFNMLSLGGGPGYDYVGALLAETYITAAAGLTTIQCTVLDYEEGWGSLVAPMNTATSMALESPTSTNSSVTWGGKCDITKPLSHPSNAGVLASMETTDLYVCQYCIAENARILRESDFIFFSDLLKAAKDGTLFILTETTPRLWPEFADLILQQNPGGHGFELGFPRVVRRGTSGPQLLIRKKEGASICDLQMDFTDEYRKLNQLHERKIERGYERPARKIRGSKA